MKVIYPNYKRMRNTGKVTQQEMFILIIEVMYVITKGNLKML